MSTSAPGQPVSLVTAPDNDNTVANRRYIKGATATRAAPTGSSVGARTKNKRWITVVTKINEVGMTWAWSLYTKSDEDGEWTLDTRLGTAGVVTLAQADADNPQRTIVEIAGQDEVYISGTVTSGGGSGVDVWLLGSGQTELG